jgi:hypothetical protein
MLAAIFHEDVLSDVSGFVGVTGHLVGHRHHLLAVQPDDLVKCP